VLASDADPAAIAVARENARRAGADVRFEVRPIADLALEEPSLVLTNPPYGERLAASRALYQEISAALRRQSGSRVAVLTSDPALADAMRRKPARWQSLRNGPIEVRLLVYDF
jgi:23S rRNA G2445 N2-methylase RlmL